MVSQLKVPADAIIMESHARHTMTSIRNANCIVFRNRMSEKKPVLGVSTASHITYIISERFKKVCMRDMGLVHYKDLKRIADDQIVYIPFFSSLQINAKELLDP
ncbi:MAG TPA: hypothetical protein VFX43_19230 [Chitinophagaceae bacterium]|jgi:hypothetical protein|nr:hypothetical protein [Chitinophagaceae bacterium]